MARQKRTFASVNENDTFTHEKEQVTTLQLAMYAGASGDFNLIHYDHHFAVEAGLGGVIAHGMLTMGSLTQAVTDWAGAGALVKDIRSRFVSIVRPGEQVTFKGVVTGKGAGGTCDLDIDGFVGDRRVITGSAVVSLPNA